MSTPATRFAISKRRRESLSAAEQMWLFRGVDCCPLRYAWHPVLNICGLTGCESAAHYSAAKGGMIGFTKALAREVVSRGIHVNAVAPGYIETPLLSVLNEAQRARILAEVPLGRFGTVDEVASLVLYLVSSHADFMVGQVVSPNGGQMI